MDARLAGSWLDYARAVSAMAEAMARTPNIADGLNALIAAALPLTTRGEGVARC